MSLPTRKVRRDRATNSITLSTRVHSYTQFRVLALQLLVRQLRWMDYVALPSLRRRAHYDGFTVLHYRQYQGVHIQILL